MLNKLNIIPLLSIILLFNFSRGLEANNKPLIFPLPLSVEITGGSLTIDNNTVIVVPNKRSEANTLITELLQAEFSDKYRLPINLFKKNILPANRKYILIGTLNNLLVKKYCTDNSLTDKVNELGEEGYLLIVNEKGIVIASKNRKGAFYGFQSLRQLLKKENNKVTLPKLKIEDKPQLQFRGIKMYLPGRDNMIFFKRFIRDFMAKYKFNKIILELNANMRLESHPELNVGTIEFGNELNASRRGRPLGGKHKESQNSSHHDNADGNILEKWEIADLINYVRKFNIEVIPEIPSLTHSYYLLFGHKELAELPDREYPDTYCPLKPEIYKIYFDVLNEYIDVIHPEKIHVGHDEWRMEKDVCELCKGKDYGKLFADDINRIHGFLTKKGIRMVIWGDHLLESVRKKDHRTWKTSAGYKYNIPGALKHEQVKNLIPKDILIFNWFWGKTADKGLGNDIQLADFGFEQIYGNLRTDIKKWDERIKINGLLGGAPSSWAATTEFNFGKDQMYDFLGCANLLWSVHHKSPTEIAFVSQSLMPSIKEDLKGEVLPSSFGIPIVALNIEENLNSTLQTGIDSLRVNDLQEDKIEKDNIPFLLSDKNKRAAVVYSVKDKSKPREIKNIKINEDFSSVIFLHASAKEAKNAKAYRMIYNFEDTAELLGWYEIVYDDGFIITIPIRYGVNILDWDAHRRIVNNEKGKSKYAQNKYAYEAAAINVSNNSVDNPITFWKFKWINQRPGKSIKEINLKSVKYKNKHENAVILLSVSVVKKNSAENIKVIEDE